MDQLVRYPHQHVYQGTLQESRGATTGSDEFGLGQQEIRGGQAFVLQVKVAVASAIEGLSASAVQIHEVVECLPPTHFLGFFLQSQFLLFWFFHWLYF